VRVGVDEHVAGVVAEEIDLEERRSSGDQEFRRKPCLFESPGLPPDLLSS
jgi:hypothetical protein